MSYERMLEEEERLKEEIQEMLEEAEATDREEDERFGRENRGDELPEELERLQTIQQAKTDLEKEAKQGRVEEGQVKADRAKERAETHESKTDLPHPRWRPGVVHRLGVNMVQSLHVCTHVYAEFAPAFCFHLHRNR